MADAREALLGAMRAVVTAKPRAVTVPGIGQVFVRSPSVAEVSAMRSQTADADDAFTLARGVCRVLCDEEGNRILDPLNQEHVDLVGKMPWASLSAVITAANEIIGTTEGSAPGN